MSRDSGEIEVPRLRPPDDGIVSSGRAPGFIGELWTAAISTGRTVQQDRLARGRTFARAGRVRNVRITPGFVTAEVVASEQYSVSIRVRTFDEAEWAVVREILLSRLGTIAALLEHRVPKELVDALKARGIRLVPASGEIEGDCTCADFAHPCAHTAAAHAILVEALEGDPFLLFTLRGRTSEALLADFRRAWGDDLPIRSHDGRADEDLDAAAFDRPVVNTPLEFVLQAVDTPAVGLRALGPPPGQVDLVRALTPLYVAGAGIALEVAMRESAPKILRRRAPAEATTLRPVPEPREVPARISPPKPSNEDNMNQSVPADLTERVVNTLAELGSAKSKDIADKIGVDMLLVREELISLEVLGIVYRTGQTRGTRWWLG